MSSPLGSFLFLALASTTSLVQAETITLPWCIPAPDAGSYERRWAKEGDTIVFDWRGEAHDVWIYPSGECFDKQDREYLGEQRGASYTFSSQDVGTNKTFVCTISSHCAMGQRVVFDVVGADDKEGMEYILSTPCGKDGFLGDPPTEAPVGADSSATGAIATTAMAAILGLGTVLFV